MGSLAVSTKGAFMPVADSNIRLSGTDARDKEKPICLAGSALGDRCHICAFFNSPEEEYRVLLPFVLEGLERGEKLVYTIDPERRIEHLERLRAGGIDVATLLRTGQFEVRTWSDTHLLDGHFDQHRTLELFGRVIKNAKEQGFPLARFVTQMEWAVENREQITDLLELKPPPTET
jgi:MEDS: MEthanogen/methylotroph, DcmR Sensory domain